MVPMCPANMTRPASSRRGIGSLNETTPRIPAVRSSSKQRAMNRDSAFARYAVEEHEAAQLAAFETITGQAREHGVARRMAEHGHPDELALVVEPNRKRAAG